MSNDNTRACEYAEYQGVYPKLMISFYLPIPNDFQIIFQKLVVKIFVSLKFA